MTTVQVGKVPVGPAHPLVLIAGPCVVEPGDVLDRTAAGLVEICAELALPLIFKSSYEKDNRTSREAYRGPGLEPGLEALARVGRRHGLPLLSDVHRPEDVPAAARVLDAIQVPAFLSRQTSLLEAAGSAGVPVNLKKGQFMSPLALAGSLEKLRGAGCRQVLLTERGTSFGYERLVCDLAALPELRRLGCPLVLDAGHAAPDAESIGTLALAGVAAGVDALFLECHPHPPAALCDGGRMLSLRQMRDLLGVAVELARVVRRG